MANEDYQDQAEQEMQDQQVAEEQVEQEEAASAEQAGLMAAAQQERQKKKSRVKKKIEKKIVVWLVTSGCSCCLPVLVFIATLSLVTIIVFYIEGFFQRQHGDYNNFANAKLVQAIEKNYDFFR